MNKPKNVFGSTVFVTAVVAVFSFAFLFAGGAYAASTIGTNMSTTGTFTQTVSSATAARFQNAAGTTTVLVVDTTNSRVGVMGAPSTTFEVQGTASASYFLTSNTLQVGGFASVAYSRFGTNATTLNFLTNANDLLVSGRFEVDASAQFDRTVQIQGTASASYFLTANTIQVGGNASVAYNRFGTAATTHVGTISDNDDVIVSGGFEVNGSAAFDGFALFGAGGSISTNFEVTGNNRFGINAGTETQATFEVGGTASISGTASVSGNFSVGKTNTGSSSFEFDSLSTTQGACFKIKDMDGSGYTYLIVNNGTGTFSTNDCRN